MLTNKLENFPKNNHQQFPMLWYKFGTTEQENTLNFSQKKTIAYCELSHLHLSHFSFNLEKLLIIHMNFKNKSYVYIFTSPVKQ